MDLDAMLDEAAAVTFKPAEAPKRKQDAAEIKPFLASTALVTPTELRDKWTAFVRRDNNVTTKIQFLPSKSYQTGDSVITPAPNSNRILFETVKTSTTKVGLSDIKSNKLLALVNPATDNEIGRRLQVSYERYVLESLKKDVLSDVNYDPTKFPHLAAVLGKL